MLEKCVGEPFLNTTKRADHETDSKMTQSTNPSVHYLDVYLQNVDLNLRKISII